MNILFIILTFFSFFAIGEEGSKLHCNVALRFEGKTFSRFPHIWTSSKSDKIKYKATLSSASGDEVENCSLNLQTNIDEKIIVNETYSCGGEFENEKFFSFGYGSSYKDIPSFGGEIFCLYSSSQIESPSEIIKLTSKRLSDLAKSSLENIEVTKQLEHTVSSKKLFNIKDCELLQSGRKNKRQV